MWDNIRWEGDDNWIAESIRQGTCMAVTDGSYMKTLYPDIHSAAFVLECRNKSGKIWGDPFQSLADAHVAIEEN